MVTGPMPRKPNATRPNEKTGEASKLLIVIRAPRPWVLMSQAVPIRMIRTIPIQKALKFPAVRPERMLSEAPPSRDAVTTSRTWREWVEVKKVVTSGITAPANVPQVMIDASFHQSVGSPRSEIKTYEVMYVQT